ncbi:MAG: RHS repeat protein [Candidatus Acidiferrales bacterium]
MDEKRARHAIGRNEHERENDAAGSAYNLNMTSYAPDGNILGVNDSANGNWTYTYDDFNRLIGANQNSGQAVYSYAYDRFGNRWQQNGPHTMLLTFSGANNRMDGYSYDADGNVLNDGAHSYAYDAENRIISVDGGATTYVYDANGQRVRKTVRGASTDYVYDLAGHAIAEVNASGWQRGEVYAGGRHIATYVNSTTYFDHGDWLGTERVRTAVNGSVCESIASLPFGDGQSTTGSCADASTRHFTGKERDPESNLDYFGARYYSSSMGRFLSPDWAAKATAVPYANFGDPQASIFTAMLETIR